MAVTEVTEATVIDTLRYADKLKAAGVQAPQAEAMSRALNDELTGGVATKDDLNHAVGRMESNLANAVERLESKLEGEIERMATKSDLDHAVGEMKGQINVLDAKFDALRDRVDTQSRHVFLVLALIAALGLYNAVSPHINAPATADARPAAAVATAAQTPKAPDDGASTGNE